MPVLTAPNSPPKPAPPSAPGVKVQETSVWGQTPPVMVSCVLLLAAIYYDMGSTGGTYAALGCALFITAIFAPIPRWVEASLEVVAATGIVRGGVMLGLPPADTGFLTCALAFVVWLNWVDHNPPSEDGKKRKSIDTPQQKRVDRQVSTHHLTSTLHVMPHSKVPLPSGQVRARGFLQPHGL